MNNFLNYNAYAESPTSEKITLAQVNCKQRLYGFTQVDSSNVYSKVTDHFVTKCQIGETHLEEVSTIGEVTSSGEYHFDIATSTLSIYTENGFLNEETDPEVIPTYKLFFSSSPINLSHDLGDQSHQVYYEPRIISSPGFSSLLDSSQTGISLTGSGILKLNNGDLFFKDIFDLFIFEHQEVAIYSFNRTLDPSQAKVIYKGNITDKTYNQNDVSFRVKDVINVLEEELPLGKYSEITDTINITEEIGKYVKRRIYGYVDNLKCQTVDMLYDSNLDKEAYILSGGVTGEVGSSTLTGTNFLTEVSTGDSINIGEENYTVDVVYSDTSIILSEELASSVNNAEAKIEPTRPWSNSNRKFLICGHPLHNIATSITVVYERNRVEVSSTKGFKVNDFVEVNNQVIKIKRISGMIITFLTNLTHRPSIGDAISKAKVQSAKIKYPEREFRDINLNKNDFTITETSEATYINLTEEAELNSTSERFIPGNFYIIKGYDMVWLGKPTVFRLDALPNTAGSLYGKYFYIYSDEKQSIFWFSQDVDLDQNETAPPVFFINVAFSSINVSTDTISAPNHGLRDGEQVSFSNGDTLPGGISEGYDYYVRNSDTNNFQISVEPASNIKDITSQGTGTNEVTILKEMLEIRLSNDNLTSTEVADQTSRSIAQHIDTYISRSAANQVTLYTKEGGNVSLGSAGTSGFDLFKVMVGRTSDQAVVMPDQIKVRDYFKTFGSSTDEYASVLDVYNKSFRLRADFLDDTGFYKVQVKNIGYVDNNSNLFVSTSGRIDKDGDLITTAACAVKDLLLEGDLESRLDLTSFARSNVNIPYDLSLKIPNVITDSAPEMRDVINNINQSVLGSLVIVDGLEIAFNSLDVERTSQDLSIINDDDVLKWSIKSTGVSYKYMIAKYNFTDVDDSPSKEYLYTSDFATKYSDSDLTLEVDLYLYNEIEAIEAAQRRLYYNTLSSAAIQIDGALNLAKYEMGDKIIINFAGLYNRLGNNSSNKIMAVVSSVKKSGEKVTLVVSTQGGNIYSKVAVISDNSTSDFNSASEEEKLYSSYIVGNDATINNRNDLQGCNSIG